MSTVWLSYDKTVAINPTHSQKLKNTVSFLKYLPMPKISDSEFHLKVFM